MAAPRDDYHMTKLGSVMSASVSEAVRICGVCDDEVPFVHFVEDVRMSVVLFHSGGGHATKHSVISPVPVAPCLGRGGGGHRSQPVSGDGPWLVLMLLLPLEAERMHGNKKRQPIDHEPVTSSRH